MADNMGIFVLLMSGSGLTTHVLIGTKHLQILILNTHFIHKNSDLKG